MRRTIYFDKFDRTGWPETRELEPYFLTPKSQRWTFRTGNDDWALRVEGINKTDHLDLGDLRRTDINLYMTGHPELGVLLNYQKRGGGFNEVFLSKGDTSCLRKWVRTLQGTDLPVGLFIPYEEAWKAVKEFMETDGALPKSIEWVADEDLPEGTFPLP